MNIHINTFYLMACNNIPIRQRSCLCFDVFLIKYIDYKYPYFIDNAFRSCNTHLSFKEDHFHNVYLSPICFGCARKHLLYIFISKPSFKV